MELYITEKGLKYLRRLERRGPIPELGNLRLLEYHLLDDITHDGPFTEQELEEHIKSDQPGLVRKTIKGLFEAMYIDNKEMTL